MLYKAHVLTIHAIVKGALLAVTVKQVSCQRISDFTDFILT